jgi:hypothetical protein
MAESSDGLQKTLNCFEKYYDLWKLTVNTTKTKVVIFSKKKVGQNQSFKIKGQNIEIIDSYCYLGMLLNYNENFCTARKKITEQAHKALFAVYRKNRANDVVFPWRPRTSRRMVSLLDSDPHLVKHSNCGILHEYI